MSRDNKKGLLVIFLVLLALCAISFVIWSMNEIERRDKRAELESSLAIHIEQYVNSPDAKGLKGLDVWLHDYLLNAKEYGYSNADISKLFAISEKLSEQTSLLCSTKKCADLQAKSREYSEIVENYKQESEQYAAALKRAESEKISMVRFICAALARESVDSYVFYCSADGSQRSYLAMNKSDYNSIKSSGYGFLINEVLPAKDAGMKSTRIDGVDTIIQTYTLAEMPKKPDILFEYNEVVFKSISRQLVLINQEISDIVAENFIDVHNNTVQDIYVLSEFSGHVKKYNIRLLKSNNSFVDGVLRQTYGSYDRLGKCWRYHSQKFDSDYCISLLAQQEVVVDGRRLIAIAVKGVGRDVMPGMEMLGYYLIDQVSNVYLFKRKEVYFSNEDVKVDDIHLEEIGSGAYAWIYVYQYEKYKNMMSKTMVLPLFGEASEEAISFDSAYDSSLTYSAPVTMLPDCYECLQSGDLFIAKMHFDNKSNLPVYPLTIELKGVFNGERVESKARFIFDETLGRYFSQNPLDDYMKKLALTGSDKQ